MRQALSVVHIRSDYKEKVEEVFIGSAIRLVLGHPLSLYGRQLLLPLREEHMAGDYSPIRLPSWVTDINMYSQYGKSGHFYNWPKRDLRYTRLGHSIWIREVVASLTSILSDSLLRTVGTIHWDYRRHFRDALVQS
jgi:hypothetical protein